MNRIKNVVLALLFASGLHAATHTAEVIESLSSNSRYTYIKVQEGDEQYWIAMTKRNVKKGDAIEFRGRGWKRSFYSKRLGRTFDKVLFASDVEQKKIMEETAPIPDVMASQYEQNGTITIAKLLAKGDCYSGEKVRVRGKVTKVLSQIMKRNWVHLQDGSTFKGQDSLVFTTRGEMPEVGSVVTAEGVVASEKDFGYGYFYPVIVEHSTFSRP